MCGRLAAWGVAGALGAAWLWVDVKKKEAEVATTTAGSFTADEAMKWNRKVREEHPGVRRNLHIFPADQRAAALQDAQAVAAASEEEKKQKKKKKKKLRKIRKKQKAEAEAAAEAAGAGDSAPAAVALGEGAPAGAAKS